MKVLLLKKSGVIGAIKYNNKFLEVNMKNQKLYSSSSENKERLLCKLPFKVDDFTIRELSREDIDIYASWPDYPSPYEMFNSSLKTKPISARDTRWESYCKDNNLITLVVEHEKEKVVGKFSLVDVNWKEMSVENMGIRVHPHWCNKGHGTKILKSISHWCFKNGIEKIRFDVLSTNQRAVKSYENAGYRIIDEFKRGDAIFYLMELKFEGK